MSILSLLKPSVVESCYVQLMRIPLTRVLVHNAIRCLIPEVLTIDGVEVLMNRADPVVCGALALRCYENFEVAIFKTLLRPGMRVVDVGANIGLFSALAASRVGKAGRVLSVEPVPENCERIRGTAARNGFCNVTVVQKAVSDKPGEMQLYLSPDNKGDNRLFAGGAKWEEIPVAVDTLDAILCAADMTHVDLIKIDIQGGEGLALRGMAEAIRSNPHLVVLMEFWAWGLTRCGTPPQEVVDVLLGAGFSLYRLDADAQAVVPVADVAELLVRKEERAYTNLLLRGPTAPAVWDGLYAGQKA